MKDLIKNYIDNMKIENEIYREQQLQELLYQQCITEDLKKMYDEERNASGSKNVK